MRDSSRGEKKSRLTPEMFKAVEEELDSWLDAQNDSKFWPDRRQHHLDSLRRAYGSQVATARRKDYHLLSSGHGFMTDEDPVILWLEQRFQLVFLRSEVPLPNPMTAAQADRGVAFVLLPQNIDSLMFITSLPVFWEDDDNAILKHVGVSDLQVQCAFPVSGGKGTSWRAHMEWSIWFKL